MHPSYIISEYALLLYKACPNLNENRVVESYSTSHLAKVSWSFASMKPFLASISTRCDWYEYLREKSESLDSPSLQSTIKSTFRLSRPMKVTKVAEDSLQPQFIYLSEIPYFMVRVDDWPLLSTVINIDIQDAHYTEVNRCELHIGAVVLPVYLWNGLDLRT